MPKGSWKEFDSVQSESPISNAKEGMIGAKQRQQVRVQMTKSGKRGKTVTSIFGLEFKSSIEAKALLKALKAYCGTGGTIKKNVLELQGDQVELAIDHLRKQGYFPKKSGG